MSSKMKNRIHLGGLLVCSILSLGCSERLTKALTPQFFAEANGDSMDLETGYTDGDWGEGLQLKFEMQRIDGTIDVRPDELLRSAEGVGDVDGNERIEGRRSPEMAGEAPSHSTDIS